PPRQILYYHLGLGTMGAFNALTPSEKWATRVLGLAFGYGLSQYLVDLYARVMETYEFGGRASSRPARRFMRAFSSAWKRRRCTTTRATCPAFARPSPAPRPDPRCPDLRLRS